MQLTTIAAFLFAAPFALAETHNPRIVLTNDDGWANANIRVLFDKLVADAHYVVLSAPADDQSDAGSRSTPEVNRTTPCQFDSCTAPAGPVGWNETSRRLNWVNNGPVGAMRYGMEQVSRRNWNSQTAELAVVGIDIGNNLGDDILTSATIAAACEAAKPEPDRQHGSKTFGKDEIPAIAFSGATGENIPFTTDPMPMYLMIYTDLAKRVTNTISKVVKRPYLPENTFLNVNFPASSSEKCSGSDEFKFVLSRIGLSKESKRDGMEKRSDVEFKCGDNILPTETEVVNHDGCYVSISVGDATTKGDVSEHIQATVEEKLYTMLSCLPGWLE